MKWNYLSWISEINPNTSRYVFNYFIMKFSQEKNTFFSLGKIEELKSGKAHLF